MIRAKTAALLVALMGAACTRQDPPSIPAEAAPADSATQAAAPVNAPNPAVPIVAPCEGAQLKLSAEGGDAGMGHRVTIVGVTNTGSRACGLTGYPTVTLQDAEGRTLSGIRAEQNPGSYLRSGEAPTPVTLAANGKAFFDVAWTVVPHEGEGETTCPSAARIRVAPPGDASATTLAQTFTPCGGRVEVSPFRAVAEPPPPTA